MKTLLIIDPLIYQPYFKCISFISYFKSIFREFSDFFAIAAFTLILIDLTKVETITISWRFAR